MAELARRIELAGDQERNRLHRTMRNGAWLSAVTHGLNVMDLSLEEFRDNLCLKYEVMPQDIPVTCDGYGKKLSIEHSLSCSRGDLVLARHDDAAKEGGTLGARDLVPSAISYEPKINSTTLQGERTGAGARQENETVNGGTETVGDSQGSRLTTVNGEAILSMMPGQVEVPAKSGADHPWSPGPSP